MLVQDVLDRLRSLGSEKLRRLNEKHDVGENQFGVKMGDIRALAKEIKVNPALARELWATGNLEAMLLATLILGSKPMPVEELDEWVAATPNVLVADWLITNVVKGHPQKASRREVWMDSDHAITARLGWSLTAERIIKSPEGLDLPGLLDRIEAEMPNAPSAVQWNMNYCLAEIGIHHPDLRERAIAMGHRLGMYRDYPVSKGCTSPFAPIWIAEMVSRQE